MLDWFIKQTSKITDNNNQYKFYVKHQPQIIDSTSTLTLTAYTSKMQNAIIPCIYKWYKIRNGLTIQVPHFKGSSYICEPSDVGSIIQAEIISTDREYPGTAILQFGPVKLDLMLKKQIQGALASRTAVTFAYLCQRNEQRQCQLRIFEDTIKISPVNSQNYYIFDYSLSQPRFQVVAKDPNRINIIFNEKYQKQAKKFLLNLMGDIDMASSIKLNPGQVRFELRFPNRIAKDSFLFITKSFYTKRELKSSVIINKIQKIDFSNNQNFNYILEIESLRNDLIKMYQLNKKLNLDKKLYQEEIHKLQKQIQDIIVTYTKIVQEKYKNQIQLNQSYSILNHKKDQILSKKYRNLEKQNCTLNDRLRTLTQEVDKIRFNKSLFKNNPEFNQPNNINTSNAFKKKQSAENAFVNMLDQLNQSQIIHTGHSNIHDAIEKIREQKRSLQNKLEKSFQKIDYLEKKLYESTNNHNMSSINFTYGKNNSNKLEIDQNNKNNISMAQLDNKNILQNNYDLKKANENLLEQKRKLERNLNDQIKSVKKLEFLNNSLKNELTKQENSKFVKEHSIQREVEHFYQQNHKFESIIKSLERQNQQLKNQIENLNREKSHLENKYKKKISDLHQQLEMLKRNQDALNRSQHLSLEMQDYNEEQLKVLRQHNEFLTTENQKLAKICERYMNDAKQTTKLRQQILSLKQQLNSKKLNPENTEIIN